MQLLERKADITEINWKNYWQPWEIWNVPESSDNEEGNIAIRFLQQISCFCCKQQDIEGVLYRKT